MNQSMIRNRVRREYTKLVSDLYLHTDFDPRMGNVIISGGLSYGGYSEETYRKGVINDFDGVFNAQESPELMEIFLDDLSGLNSVVRRMKDSIVNAIRGIMHSYRSGDDITHSVKRYTERLVEAKVDQYQFREAASSSARKLPLTPNTLPFISQLTYLGFTLSINSGSPQDALEILAEERLGIPRQFVYGTRYLFADSRLVDSVISQLGGEKEKGKKRFLHLLNCVPDFSVIVDDDPLTDAILGANAGLGLVLWVDNKGVSLDSLPGDIKVYCPEARHDMSLLVPIIQKYERARVLSFLRSPYNMKRAIEEAQNLENTAHAVVVANEMDFPLLLPDFKRSYEKLIEILGPTFPTLSSGVKKLYSGLSTEEDTETAKKLIEKIVTRMARYTPEFQGGKILDRLQSLIDELDGVGSR